jgi:SAM-dependent methyltransferase
MSIEQIAKKLIPDPLKKIIRPVKNYFLKKHVEELSFWKSRLEIDKGTFANAHYEKLLLGMAEEPNDNFLKGKVVADFGCGPRGSLVWARSANLRIGIDVLADVYAEEFTENIIAHQMIYLKSTEKVIPLPSDFVDVMFTLNAIDHVDNFSAMCSEIIRVIKPGGFFIGSFNLEELPSPCEPQQLDEKKIKDNLLSKLEIKSYRITKKGPEDDLYSPFFTNSLSYEPGQEGYLWVKAMKPL